MRAPYATGNLYVLTIPDDMGNLYDFPANALNEIRRIMSKDIGVCLEAPSKVGLFVYDNKTLVVENFNDEPVEVRIVTGEAGKLGGWDCFESSSCRTGDTDQTSGYA